MKHQPHARPHWLRGTLIAAGIGASFGWGTLGIAATDDNPTPHSDSVGAALSDAAITAKVKSNYLTDDRLKKAHIKVTTTNGVVTLTGSTPTSDAKSAAEEVAKNVEGVKSVDDELLTPSTNNAAHHTVAKAERIGSDSWITTKVKSELLTDSLTKGTKVRVKTLNGVVMLRGALPSDDAVQHAKDIAEKVQGVKSVDTTALSVSPT